MSNVSASTDEPEAVVSLRYDRELRWRRELEEREPVIRQLVGHARCLADAMGNPITATDVLKGLADTGLYLIRDAEGLGQDAARWGAFLIAADPLDVEPEVESHWDVEAFDREQAAMRPRHRTQEGRPNE